MQTSTTLYQASPEELAELVASKLAQKQPQHDDLSREERLLLSLPRLTVEQAGQIIGLKKQQMWAIIRDGKLTRHGKGECLSTREVLRFAKARHQMKGEFEPKSPKSFPHLRKK